MQHVVLKTEQTARTKSNKKQAKIINRKEKKKNPLPHRHVLWEGEWVLVK
jgi:hypothetical protein